MSITIPPDRLKRAQSIAKRVSRTMSELLREAMRHYERRLWWDEVNASGRFRVLRKGLGEDEVNQVIQDLRISRHANRK